MMHPEVFEGAPCIKDRRNDETPCVDCWEAHSQADADRYSRRRAQETA